MCSDCQYKTKKNPHEIEMRGKHLGGKKNSTCHRALAASNVCLKIAQLFKSLNKISKEKQLRTLYTVFYI